MSRMGKGTVGGAWLRPSRIACGMALLLAAGIGAAVAQSQDDSEDEAIRYTSTPATDAVAKLQQRLDRKEVTLGWDGTRGYLPAVLKELGVSPASQTLVFSKTSFQRDRISPQTPRALYFNDRAYVGWVPEGSVVEVSSVDPRLGAVFYTLSQERGTAPRFVRQTHECLSCHGSTLTMGVPGHVMRSVFADRTGQPLLPAGTFITTDESPMNERWGGWYVTGTLGSQYHMGNLVTHSARQAENADLAPGSNMRDLGSRFDTSLYLNRHSDVVALMLLAHQARVQNLITRLSYQTRIALRYEQAVGKDLGLAPGKHLDSTLSRIKSVGEPLVRALLFSRELPLTSPVAGTSGFAREFESQGPRDREGRSLRELDLKQRMFRYPCSYLIYSEAFDALPEPGKDYVYRRLWQVLNGQETGSDFAHLSPEDRRAVLQILQQTKPDFAAWTAAHPEPGKA